MKLQMLMLGLILTVAAAFSGELHAVAMNLQENPVICHTPRIQMAFKISDQHIAFIESKGLGLGSELEGRSVASSAINQVRTRLTATGFTKTLERNGKRHTIHINNGNNFSQFDDYIVIRNSEGHEITYPLECENL